MKAAFYLENRDIPNVDLSRPELGNPGCGGTEFLFAALPHYLAKLRGETCTPLILANHTDALPGSVEALQVEDVFEAARCAKQQRCDFFVYRPRRLGEMAVLDLLDELQLPGVGWAHVTPAAPHLRRMAKSSALKALVCVEHEQYDLVQDTPIARKLTYIVNGFDVDGFRLEDVPEKQPGLVVYVGALVPQKGFHLLAKVWPRVLQRCPHARLTVIGTGALYDETAQLGPWSIAERSYEENHIIPHLSGSDGQPHPSVSFAGKLGLEKKTILHGAMVGVPNPTGRTENCPGSALELEASGTAIVSGAYFGLLDTVKDGVTGLLGRGEDQLVSNICTVLENPGLARRLGENGVAFIRDRYDFAKVTAEWIRLFDRLATGLGPERIPFKRNFLKHSKLAIALNRPVQIALGRFLTWPSVVEIKQALYPRISKLTSR